MQRLKLLLLLFVLSISVLFSQEETKTQKFVDFLMSSRPFEAFEYYEKYETEINQEDLIIGKIFYNAFKDAVLGEYDSSIVHFNEIFNNVSIDGKYPIIEALLIVSFNTQKYENAAYLSSKLVEMLENNDSPVSDEYKSNQIKLYTHLTDLCSILQHEDEPRICFKESCINIDFNQSYDVPILQAQVNQHSTRALFDTGASHPVLMTRQMADSIGVKVICDEIIVPFNNIPTPVSYGILDSLTIGNLTAYNLLIMIGDIDTSDIFNYLDIGIVIGLPFIRQMGTVTLDFENEKLILSAKEPVEKENYNMLLYGNSLYLRAAVNNVLHTGFIDTGSGANEITLNNHLYNKYKNEFGTIKINYIDSTMFVNYKDVRNLGILEDLKWGLPGQSPVVDISKQSRVRLDVNNQSDHYDAFYGFKFLQRFKKVVFDFNRMEFRYYYDPLREKDSRNMN